MRQIYFLLFFSLISINLQGQCDSISKEIFNIIKMEKYERFDNLIMPIEQQRKILHWPKSEETDKLLLSIIDSLKIELTASAKKLRLELLDKGFDINKTDYDRCQLTANKLDIFIFDNEKKSNFLVETRKTDRRYLMLPINQTAPELPTFEPTKIDLANSTIMIAGEKFKPFEPSKKDKEKGLEILKKCIDIEKTTIKNILMIRGMKDNNGLSILTFMTLKESEMNRFKVILEKETCEKE